MSAWLNESCPCDCSILRFQMKSWTRIKLHHIWLSTNNCICLSVYDQYGRVRQCMIWLSLFTLSIIAVMPHERWNNASLCSRARFPNLEINDYIYGLCIQLRKRNNHARFSWMNWTLRVTGAAEVKQLNQSTTIEPLVKCSAISDVVFTNEALSFVFAFPT